MKTKFIILSIVTSTIFLCGSSSEKGIDKCYVSLEKSAGLKASEPTQIKEGKFETADGAVIFSSVDGYYVEYTNKKKTIAVGVGARLLNSDTYQADTTAIISYFKQRLAEDIAFSDSKNLTELTFNGFKIYGSRANTIDLDEKYKFLGAYVLFPQKDMVVFIYFYNLGSKSKPYKDLSDLHSKINGFLGEYTGHLQKCLN